MTLPTVRKVLACALACGCVEPVAAPDRDPPPSVRFDAAGAGEASPVGRFVLEGAGVGALSSAELALFQGELTDQQLARLDPLALTKELEERRIPMTLWVDSTSSALVAAPVRALERARLYTLAARRFGRLHVLQVLDAPFTILEPVWPLRGGLCGGTLVLCAPSGFAERTHVTLAPGHIPAVLTPGIGTHRSESCARIDFDASGLNGQSILLPPELDGHWLAPTPIEVGQRLDAAVLARCEPPELELGPGCVRVEDDRLTIRNAPLPLLWRVSIGDRTLVEALGPGERFVVTGLVPESHLVVEGSAAASDGVEGSFSVSLTTAPARARVILNEVLANPAGAEPANEWVELLNDGTGVLEVGGFTLADSAGITVLPPAELPPGGHALVVREDFAPSGSDVLPAESALLIRVPQIGRSGLSNAGEALTLTDREGVVLSRFPAVPARHAGVSIARLSPEALDDAASSFAEHAPPGASPGASNVGAASADGSR